MARAEKAHFSTKEASGISIWPKLKEAPMEIELLHLTAVHLVWKRSRKSRYGVVRRIGYKDFCII
jgi:hypothetical protein